MRSRFAAYIGTYTRGESKGIYRIIIHEESGSIEDIKLAAKLENPTYMVVSRNNQYIYSVIKSGNSGGVAAFQVNNISGDLYLINYQVSEGNPPCYVSLDMKNKYLFSANYHKGCIEVYPIRDDGGLESASYRIVHQGFGPNKMRQDKPHIHYVSLTPDERHLCAVDLGIDQLILYEYNNGTIDEKGDSIALPPGCGPRHMVFHPSGKYGYILTELTSEIIVLERDFLNLHFKIIQCIPLNTEPFEDGITGGAIRMSSDGQYLYASLRGHNSSIAILSIHQSSGRAKFICRIPTCGEHPRDFQIDPIGNILIVANQYSHNLVPFHVNRANGGLSPISAPVFIPDPVCIKFINIYK